MAVPLMTWGTIDHDGCVCRVCRWRGSLEWPVSKLPSMIWVPLIMMAVCAGDTAVRSGRCQSCHGWPGILRGAHSPSHAAPHSVATGHPATGVYGVWLHVLLNCRQQQHDVALTVCNHLTLYALSIRKGLVFLWSHVILYTAPHSITTGRSATGVHGVRLYVPLNCRQPQRDTALSVAIWLCFCYLYGKDLYINEAIWHCVCDLYGMDLDVYEVPACIYIYIYIYMSLPCRFLDGVYMWWIQPVNAKVIHVCALWS